MCWFADNVAIHCCYYSRFRGYSFKAKPSFLVSHELPLEDESVDVVFGMAILHHLDLQLASDEVFRVLKKGGRVVDLGAAPGGWSQVAVKRVGGEGRVVAIDIQEMAPVAGVDFAVIDFLDPGAPDHLKERLGGEADVVLTDMAANATGHRKTDHLKIMALVEAAAQFAAEVLKPGGAFLAKVLQGGTEPTLLAELKRHFATVRHVKPAASRADSAELYLLATGFRRD